MSININVNGMNYTEKSYSERAEREKRCKNRLLKVREQSKEIAQELRDKVRIAKEVEIKKLQKIKEKELNEWKKRRQDQIQNQIDCCIQDFGNAHIAAINASCEESESLREQRDEQDLMASVRGRVAMLSEQRRRDKEAEERLQKKKRRQQKTVGIQADFLAQRGFSESNKINLIQIESEAEDDDDDEKFTNKPNPHKHQTNYNPQNFTSNSVDSSNTSENLEEEEEEEENDDSLEFNQITNLLKQKMQDVYDAPSRKIAEIVDISSETSDAEVLPAKKVSPLKKKNSPQKGILKSKKSPLKPANKKSPKTTSIKNLTENNRVRYVDFHNMYDTSHEPKKDLVKRSELSKSLNAKEKAKIYKEKSNMIAKEINEDILRQLTEIRTQEALEKEKIRRDYERLRLEMEELSKQEQELRSKANVVRPASRDQILRQEENRQKKMNAAVEKVFKKPIITCPPVNCMEKSNELNDVNVAVNSEAQKIPEINNLIKVERLKDLLEKINHQKRLILNELEKGEDIPGPDLQRVMDCLKQLEKEKAALDSVNGEKLKKIEELNNREQKIRQLEIELENKRSELLKNQQTSSASSSSNSSEFVGEAKKIITPPVEIIIKVQPKKSPRKKKKLIKCIDTLNREPGKVYPKTPIKKKAPSYDEAKSNENPTVAKTSKASSQSKSAEAPIKPILKRSLDDNSSSTSYRSIPDKLAHLNSLNSEIPDVPLKNRPTTSRKSHHKLNPALMHYITRLLGMSTNIGNQLNVDVSSVSTPGSSTINTSGNNSAINVEPSFDANRLQKLQQFIDDNYSFLNEINETVENVRQEQINDKRMEGIWRDALNKKKPKSGVTSVKESLECSENRENRGTESSKGNVKELKPAVSNIPKSHQQRVASNYEDLALANSAEYARQCKLRIDALNRKMEQVRQEKLRLIENSISSGEFNNFTEYREIAQQKASSDRATSSQKEDPPSEEINNILHKQTRPFGVSKDSGISILSRPVTSSDFRDSPDTRVISEENVFQPIKTPKVKITTSEGENETIKDISHIIKQQQKPQRPPLSLKSPQFEKQHEPHELSTIAEIETPTASKTNIIPSDDLPGVSNLHTFPDFTEYAKHIGEHELTIKSFPDLGDLKDALPDMNVETFVDPRDYNLENKTKDNDTDSFGDIMEELKKRQIVNDSFEIIKNDDDFVEKTTPTVTIQMTQPQSPRRPPPQSRIFIRTPENTGNVQVEIQQTPTKKKHTQQPIPHPESPKSNDTLSGIQEIEKDLQGAGISWAVSLLKRSEEAKKQKSSSSDDKVEIQIDMPDDTSSSSTSGRPLNLRDFLRRELMQRSRKDKYLSDESSLSSQFMRSLLNASSSSATSDKLKSDSSQNAKLRTSTPVHMKSSQTNVGGKTGGTSQQLFGTEVESVSTVRDASGSDKS